MCNFEISIKSLEFIDANKCPNCGAILSKTYDGKECTGICGFSINNVFLESIRAQLYGSF